MQPDPNASESAGKRARAPKKSLLPEFVAIGLVLLFFVVRARVQWNLGYRPSRGLGGAFVYLLPMGLLLWAVGIARWVRLIISETRKTLDRGWLRFSVVILLFAAPPLGFAGSGGDSYLSRAGREAVFRDADLATVRVECLALIEGIGDNGERKQLTGREMPPSIRKLYPLTVQVSPEQVSVVRGSRERRESIVVPRDASSYGGDGRRVAEGVYLELGM
ncbi:MAG: hypothetical protein ACYTKD_31565 [Planctomycetota bacterium]|jgi:hypothetical protein